MLASDCTEDECVFVDDLESDRDTDRVVVRDIALDNVRPCLSF